MSRSRSTSRFIRTICATTMLSITYTFAVSSVDAQATVTLTQSGGSFGSPTAADYVATAQSATTPMSFQIVTDSEATGAHSTTLVIRSSSSTLGSGKPIGDLEWRRGYLSDWHPVTTVDAEVEEWADAYSPTGHTYSNTIYFRIRLDWATTHPATYSAPVVLTVTYSKL